MRRTLPLGFDVWPADGVPRDDRSRPDHEDATARSPPGRPTM